MTNQNSTDEAVWKTSKRIFTGVAMFLLIIIAFSTVVTIDEGERGVVLTFGSFGGHVMEPGFNMKVPLVQSVVKYDVRTQKMEIAKSEAYSKDLQNVDIHSVINYTINQSDVGAVYAKYNQDIEAKVLFPLIESSVKQVVAKYTAEEMLAKRLELQTEIANTFKANAPKEILVTAYQLVNEDFSDKFEAAIEAKQIAQQNAERAEREKVEAQTRAAMNIITAQGEAEKIRIQAEAITKQGGKEYVMLQYIEAWKSGGAKMPQYLSMGSGGMPMILPSFDNLNK